MIAVHQAEFDMYASEFQARIERAGVTLTSVDGQVLERAGLLAFSFQSFHNLLFGLVGRKS